MPHVYTWCGALLTAIALTRFPWWRVPTLQEPCGDFRVTTASSGIGGWGDDRTGQPRQRPALPLLPKFLSFVLIAAWFRGPQITPLVEVTLWLKVLFIKMTEQGEQPH